MLIREYNDATDHDGLMQCIVAIQDFERNLDSRMPAGADIVEQYALEMIASCEKSSGRILVAEKNSRLAGYALVLNKVSAESVDEGDLEYALIRDLVVLDDYRGQGIGARLLQAAENEARKSGAKWLRIEVLNANETARKIYLSKGFQPYTTLLEKSLRPDG